jgi:hypothetical protein
MPQQLPPDIPGEDDMVLHEIDILGKRGVTLDEDDV